MSIETKQMSFVVDADTLQLIQMLKKELGAKTTAAVFRKSLALAKVAVEEAKDDGGIVNIRGKSKTDEPGTLVALKA